MNETQAKQICAALAAKTKRDLADPEYKQLNVALWHRLAGHLQNGVADLTAQVEELFGAIDNLNQSVPPCSTDPEVGEILDVIAKIRPEAEAHLQRIEDVSEKMDAELEWYSTESIEAAWEAAGVKPA